MKNLPLNQGDFLRGIWHAHCEMVPETLKHCETVRVGKWVFSTPKYVCQNVILWCQFSGKLTIIVGQVGSGKSSFISALLGEMSTISGSVVWDRWAADSLSHQYGELLRFLFFIFFMKNLSALELGNDFELS